MNGKFSYIDDELYICQSLLTTWLFFSCIIIFIVRFSYLWMIDLVFKKTSRFSVYETMTRTTCGLRIVIWYHQCTILFLPLAMRVHCLDFLFLLNVFFQSILLDEKRQSFVYKICSLCDLSDKRKLLICAADQNIDCFQDSKNIWKYFWSSVSWSCFHKWFIDSSFRLTFFLFDTICTLSWFYHLPCGFNVWVWILFCSFVSNKNVNHVCAK